MLHEVEILVVQYVKSVHEYLGYEIDPWKAAHRLGLGVAWGADTSLDGKIIVLGPECRVSRKAAAHAIRHEIAHHLVQRSGAETQILKLRSTYESAMKQIEKIVYHSELVLQIPDWIYFDVLKRHGHMPTAILEMCERTDAELGEGLRRWVYAEVGEKRAAFIQRKHLIVDVAAANLWLPYWLYDEVGNPLECLPHTHLLHLPASYGRDNTLGLVYL